MGNSNTKIFDERIWSDKIVFNSKTSFIRKIYKLDDKYDIIINGNENLICKSFTNIPKGIINDESYIEDYPEAIAIEVPIGIYENSNIDTSNTNTIANEISNDIYVKRIKFIPDIVTIRTRFLNDLYDELKIKISTIKISNFIHCFYFSLIGNQA